MFAHGYCRESALESIVIFSCISQLMVIGCDIDQCYRQAFFQWRQHTGKGPQYGLYQIYIPWPVCDNKYRLFRVELTVLRTNNTDFTKTLASNDGKQANRLYCRVLVEIAFFQSVLIEKRATWEA